MNYHYYSPIKNIFEIPSEAGMKTLRSFTVSSEAFSEGWSEAGLPKDKKIVLVGGCFDIIHFGHIQFLQKAKEAGDYLIVALEPDERITQYKNRTPTHTQAERAYNLLALRYVDDVILLPLLHSFHDYLALVQTIKPHVIAITNNDPQLANKQKQADAVNAQLIIVTDVIGSFSSSAIYNSLY